MAEQFELITMRAQRIAQALVYTLWNAKRHPVTVAVFVRAPKIVDCAELPDGSMLPLGVAA